MSNVTNETAPPANNDASDVDGDVDATVVDSPTDNESQPSVQASPQASIQHVTLDDSQGQTHDATAMSSNTNNNAASSLLEEYSVEKYLQLYSPSITHDSKEYSKMLFTMAISLTPDEMKLSSFDELIKKKILVKGDIKPSGKTLMSEILRRYEHIRHREQIHNTQPIRRPRPKHWCQPEGLSWLAQNPLSLEEKPIVIKAIDQFLASVLERNHEKLIRKMSMITSPSIQQRFESPSMSVITNPPVQRYIPPPSIGSNPIPASNGMLVDPSIQNQKRRKTDHEDKGAIKLNGSGGVHQELHELEKEVNEKEKVLEELQKDLKVVKDKLAHEKKHLLLATKILNHYHTETTSTSSQCTLNLADNHYVICEDHGVSRDDYEEAKINKYLGKFGLKVDNWNNLDDGNNQCVVHLLC